MTRPETRAGALLAALKEDLPSARDDARVRRKLANAGLALGASAGAAVGTAAATAAATNNLAHASIASTAKATTTSSAPSAAPAGASAAASAGASAGAASATATKATSLIATTWTGLSTATKLAIAGVVAVGGGYPAVSQWTASHGPAQIAQKAPPPRGLADAVWAPGDDGTVASSAVASSAVASSAVASSAVAGGRRGELPAPLAPTSEESAHATPRAILPPADVAMNAKARSTRRGPGPATVRHSATSSAMQTSDQSLRDETSLIERALVATRADDKAAAARWLAEHERRYPSGVLAKERQRLWGALR